MRPRWLAARIEDLPRVGSRVSDEAAARLSQRGVDVLHLHAHPKRTVPAHVLEAVEQAARANLVAPSRGLEGLRQAVAAALSTELPRAIDPAAEVLITAGGMQALDLIFGASLAPGDEVLSVAPGFFVEGLVEPRGGRLVHVRTKPEDGYAIDWEAVERAITPSTRVFLAITPGNPTGYVYTHWDIVALAEIAERHNLLVVSDESYDRLIYDTRRHLSPFGLAQLATRVVMVRSFTKSFAMPGWRVGYIAGPRELVDGCLKLLEWSALYGSAVPQAAAEAALTGPQTWLDGVAAEFEARRDRLLDVLRGVGVATASPQGGPFLFPHVGNDALVARELLQIGIAVVPGTALRGPGHVRLPFGGSEKTIDALAERLARAFLDRDVRSQHSASRVPV